MEKYISFNRIPSRSDLPTLPQILLRLTEICENDNVDNADSAAVIKMDPALSIKVLMLAGFSSSSAFEKGLDVTDAVSVIGAGAVRNIVLYASVRNFFEKAGEKPFFSLGRFWAHSLHCAILARSLASQSGYPKPEDAYTAGLLHDLGKLVVWTQFGEAVQDPGGLCWNSAAPFSSIEDRLGVHHAEAGASALHLWGFPSFVADAVLYHHEPPIRIAQASPLVKIVYAANQLCRQEPSDNDGFWAGLESILPLSRDFLIGVSDLAIQEAGESARHLKIDLSVGGKDRLSALENRTADWYEPGQVFHGGLSLLPENLLDLLQGEDQDSVVSAVGQKLQIMMDADRVLFFLPEGEKGCLQATGESFGQMTFNQSEIEIPLEVEKSLIVSAHKQRVPLDSFSISFKKGPVILDEQIISFLGKDGIICVPMVSRGVSEGVIVMPLHLSERSRVYSRMRLVQLISAHAATALRKRRLRREEVSGAQQGEEEAMSLTVQKMLHEVNSPLTIVKNYLKVIGDKLSKEKPVFDELRIVTEETNRLASLLGRIPPRSEIQSYELESVDINAFLRDMAKIVKESFPPDPEILFRLDLEQDLPAVEADSNTLKQIFANLFNNSAEAMTAGGTITVRTSYGSDDSFFPPGPLRSGEGLGVIKIVVQDDGFGVPEEIRDRIFEPFVSSKPKPHSGLGLSIVRGMVTALGGTISCESTVRQGTSLVILLPVKGI